MHLLITFTHFFQIMGVPKLKSFLQAHFPSAFSPSTNGKSYDCCLIDVNGIMHTAARRSTSASKLHQIFHREIETILRRFTITDNVMFAIDGPGSCGKLMVQRTRRMQLGRKMLGTPGAFDRRTISTGTLFMDEFEMGLQWYAAHKIIKSIKTRPGLTFLIDGSGSAGEGEHKMIAHVKKLNATSKTIAVIGEDSDIFLLLIASMSKNIDYIHENNKQRFDVEKLRSVLASLVPGKCVQNLSIDLTALILISSGSDYLPAAAYVSLAKNWLRYLEVVKNGGKYLVDLKNQRFNLDVLEQILDDKRAQGHGYEKRRIISLSEVHDFLNGTLWSLEIYITGKCPDYHYIFQHQMGPDRDAIIRYCKASRPDGPIKQINSKDYSTVVEFLRQESIAAKKVSERQLLKVTRSSRPALDSHVIAALV